MSRKVDMDKDARQPDALPTKIWNAAFCSILLANAVMNLCQYMTNALLPKYVDALGMQAAIIGLLMSAFTFTSLLLRLIAGPIMDTYNKKYIVMIALIGLAAAFFGFGMSETFNMLMVFRLLQGVTMAFINACCLAMVADTIPKEKYASGIGYYSLGLVVAQALGPLVALELLGWFSYRIAYIISAVVTLFAALLTSQIKSKYTRTKKLKITFGNILAKEAFLPSSLQALLYMVIFAINSFLIVFAEKQNVTQNIGLYFTVNALVMLLSRPLIGKLADKYGLIKTLVPSLLSGIAALILISISTTLWMFLVAATLAAFGFGACVPISQSLTMKSVPNERRGAGSSTNYIFMDIGVLAGTNLAGIIAQSFGYPVMWNIMIIPLVIAIFIAIFARKTIYRIEENFKNRDSNTG